MTVLGCVLALLAPLAGAQEPDSARWSRQGSSLVLADSSGTIVHEVPLGLWEETSGHRLQSRQTLGGVSSSGRFAWTLEKSSTWNSAKTRLVTSSSLLRYYGAAPRELWSERGADAPGEGADPVAMSASGEIAALALRQTKDWSVAVTTFLGNALWRSGGFKNLLSISLSPKGGYAVVRWADPERGATHSFVRVATGQRVDIASEQFVPGPARISDEGDISSGDRFLRSFTPAPGEDPR